jgi:hypothetical protein
MNIKMLLFVPLMLAANILFSQKTSKEEILQSLYKSDGEQYFRIELKELGLVSQLTKTISVDKIDFNHNEVYAYANRKEFEKFITLDLPYTILPHPGDLVYEPKMLEKIDIRNINDWDFYPTYEAYVDMMNQYAADYPSLCQIVNIGSTVQGRSLLAAKISHNVGISESEPQFLYTSSIHGDETTGYVLMLRMIDYLLSNYGQNDKVTNLLNNIEIWINPLANPDGTYAGGNNTVNGARRYNANWVDLNRNYPDPKGGPHPDGNDWQIETINFMQLAEDNRFVASVNMHGGAEVCNYPWDTWQKLHPDNNWWVYVCREYADTVHVYSPAGYMTDLDNGITNGFQWYEVEGGRQDYMTYFRYGREFTLEMSAEKLLPPNQLPAHWEYNYRSLLNYLEQCTYGIKGTVKDSVTNWPLKAKVYVQAHEQDSSWVYSRLPNGNYDRLLYEGNYSVQYSAPGYFPKIINSIEVSNRNATIVDVKLVPEGVGGVGNEVISQAILVYPNPVTIDKIMINSDFEIIQISILDLTGRELLTKLVMRKTYDLQIDNLKNGMYFLKLDTEKGIGIKKIIVSR